MPSYLVTVGEAAITGESTRIILLNTKQQLIKAIAVEKCDCTEVVAGKVEPISK